MATNTRKLASLLGASGAGIANDGTLTSAAIGEVIVAADIANDAVGTAELANDVAISTTGAITTTGAFTSVGIDDNSAETSMTISSDGYVTKPLQPGFSANPDHEQTNMVAGNYHSLGFETNVWAGQDRDSGFNTGWISENLFPYYDIDGTLRSSGTTGDITYFLAPVTGLYYISINCVIVDMVDDAPYIQCRIYTSNRTYPSYMSTNWDGDHTYDTFSYAVIADMDVGDKAWCRFMQNADAGTGAAQTDFRQDSFFTVLLMA